MKKRIVLGYPVNSEHIQLIQQSAESNGIQADVVACEQQELPKALLDADIFCGHGKVPINWSDIVAKGKLKWIQSSAAGLDHCLVPSVVESEIMVTGASGLFSPQVAETAIALLLGLVRKMNEFWVAQQNRVFERRPTDQLHGKNVGIVGMGGNGLQIARCLEPFGPILSGVDYFHGQDWPPSLTKVYSVEEVEEFLAPLDVLILTVGLTSMTTRWFDSGKLNALRDGAYVINVGRGDVLVETDLVESLQSGKLAGAGLDVCETEPLPPESKLWELSNVLISPHIGAQSPDRYDLVTKLFCENLQAYCRQIQTVSNEPDAAGETNQLINLVDKQLGFPHPKNRLTPSTLEKWKNNVTIL